uniref:TAFA chemokine like family member 5b n=1 Tax=Kryptolebias marmoratus TaxID=37003 RepID=A0A3Q3ANI5_KRYMA
MAKPWLCLKGLARSSFWPSLSPRFSASVGSKGSSYTKINEYHYLSPLCQNTGDTLIVTSYRHHKFHKRSQRTCEIVTLDRDSSQPRRTIARQTARCACRKGQIAGTTRARPACVDGKVTQKWCDMTPCLHDEVCNLLVNQSGWTCTQPGGRVKTTTVRMEA